MQHKPTADDGCSVYRIYDAAGELMYVGVTKRGHKRQTEHVAHKRWADEMAETQWEHYPTREEALHREAHLIRTHHPRYNKIHRLPDAGQPERQEYRLRAQQYDVMVRLGREVKAVDRQTKNLMARVLVMHELQSMFNRVLRKNRPPSGSEINRMYTLLRRLEKFADQASEEAA